MGSSHADGWQAILPDVEVFRDSCNVYAVRSAGGTLFINAGTGTWLRTIAERFRPPYALLCTHYFRDHAAGAAEASRSGMTVFVPEGEADIFADPVQHFRAMQDYIVYDNIWESFAPIAPAVVEPAQDYATLDLGGLAVTIVPLPGVTPNHCGFALVTPHSGRHVVFCGEAIHSPGRMARIAPLQYNYNDLGGAVNAFYSAGELRRRRPDALLPSQGEPMLQGIDQALAQLQDSLRQLCQGRPHENAMLDVMAGEELEEVTPHVLMSPRTEAVSWYLISDSGKALVIDYGYRGASGAYPFPGGWHWPANGSRSRRRPLLHGLKELERRFGIDRIDVALISHFHDDHVAGVPILQRLHDTAAWVPENVADLVAHPEAHRFPCGWPHPLRVDRRLPLAEPFAWEEYRFRLAPMSGHTRFSAAIFFEADGKRFAHTGDQHFFLQSDAPGGNSDWTGAQIMQNHVFRNGAFLDSFRESAGILRDWRPDIVLSGHRLPMHTNDAFFTLVEAWGDEFARLHRSAMALGDAEPHFGLDSWGGWIWPYRSHVQEGEAVSLCVTVRNPLPVAAVLTVRLVGPEGWQGGSVEVKAGPRQEVSCPLSISPAGPCRRQPIAAELGVDGRTFGQVTEALVTVGGPHF
jgi:glyoxylase-like metal-dependent hydrolase (beta-lactamase superfamily II)